MIWFLRLFFTVVLVSMLWVTSWASLQVSLFEIPRSVGSHPWFIATLFDAYWGFFTFYVWLAYKEAAWLPRVLWFIALVLLGNIAMSIYLLILLWRVRPEAPLAQVLLRNNDLMPWWVPGGMIAALLLVAFAV